MKISPTDKICNYYEFEWLGGEHPFFYAENLDEAISIALKSEYGRNCNLDMILKCRVIQIPLKIKGKTNWTQSRWSKEHKIQCNGTN